MLASTIASLETWETLHDVAAELGLAPVDAKGGKSKYLAAVLKAASAQTVAEAAAQALDSWPGIRGDPPVWVCEEMRDCLDWLESGGKSHLTRVTRLRVADLLGSRKWWGRLTPEELFGEVAPHTIPREWGVLEALTGQSQDHMYDAQWLRDRGIAEWPDPRFERFLEAIVSPETQAPEELEELVRALNEIAAGDGHELRPGSFAGGLPVYRLVRQAPTRGVEPRFLVFGGTFKPDIILADAVQLEPAVVAGDVIAYDRAPGPNGLLWRELCEWWGAKHEVPDLAAARKQLGARLLSSVDEGPETLFFKTYFQILSARLGARLPALLPQVWLHYDPRSQTSRGGKPVLFRQRMDFMVLLPGGAAVVIEIDGRQHYADAEGRADPSKYAAQAAEDRRIRLLGYEVFRFGGAEFVDRQAAATTVGQFLLELMERHGVLGEQE